MMLMNAYNYEILNNYEAYLLVLDKAGTVFFLNRKTQQLLSELHFNAPIGQSFSGIFSSMVEKPWLHTNEVLCSLADDKAIAWTFTFDTSSQHYHGYGQLVTLRKEYESLAKVLPTAVAILNNKMAYLYCNPKWAQYYEINANDAQGKCAYASQNFPLSKAIYQRCLQGKIERMERSPLVRANGKIDWIKWEAHPWYTDEHTIGGIIIFAEMVTERVLKENKLLKINRELTLQNYVSDAFLLFKNEEVLLQELAFLLVEEGGFKLAWLAYYTPEQRVLRPQFTFGDDDYTAMLTFDLDNPAHQKEPTISAIQNKNIAVSNQISSDNTYEVWRINAMQHGFASSLMAYLTIDGEQDLVMGLYSTEADSFDFEEIKFIKRITANIINAIKGLRNVQKIYDTQKELLDKLKELSDYKQAIDASSIVYIIDRKGVIKYVNQNYCQISQYTEAEVIGKPYIVTTQGKWEERFIEIYETIAKGNVWKGELKNLDKYDNLYWTHTTVVPFMGEDGLPEHIVSISKDITKRKEYEQQLRLSNLIINATDDAIVSKTVMGVITSWNRGAKELFGYSEEEVIGKSILLLFPDDKIEEEAIILAKIQQGESIEYFETERKAKDGRLIPVMLTVSPIRDETGAIIGAAKIAKNIAAMKLAEKEREKVVLSLNKRVKELTLINKCSQLFSESTTDIATTLQQLVKIIPIGLQNSSLAQVTVDWQDIKIGNCKVVREDHALKVSFQTIDNISGFLQVCYNQILVPVGESPFFVEEKNLLQTVADMLVAYLNNVLQQNMLRQSELNLRTVFDTTDTVYILLDKDKKVLLQNQAAVEFVRREYGVEYAVGNYVSENFPTHVVHWLDQQFRLLSTQDKVVTTNSVTLNNGEKRWNLSTYAKILDEQGEVSGYLITIRDITARKRNEQQKEEQLKLYEELSFILSHELRHEYAKLYSIVDFVVQMHPISPSVSNIYKESKSTFEKLNSSIDKLNERIYRAKNGQQK